MAESNPESKYQFPPEIAEILLNWWESNKADLPWRANKEPYAVWVSEVMLQQTQIVTVVPYYERWMARFPSVKTLAASSIDDVLKAWEGLGYYSRARNLHKAAKIIAEKFSGRLPEDYTDLIALPGIGRYTAGAIASIAFNQQVPVLDGNIIRVLSRLTDLEEDVNKTATKNKMWQMVESLVPQTRPGDFNEALMELGQIICTVAPKCVICPLARMCLANLRNTQDQRPIRPPRKKIPHHDVVAGIIWQNEEISATTPFLITQRPLDGLLGGLWEFPGGKQESDESLTEALVREICEELAVEIRVSRHLVTVKHAYTHFRISLHAFFAFYQGETVQNKGIKDHAWVTLADLGNYAFASADKKIITALQKEISQ